MVVSPSRSPRFLLEAVRSISRECRTCVLTDRIIICHCRRAVRVGQSSNSSINGGVSSLCTSEEGSHETKSSSSDNKTASERGATSSTRDRQDVGVIRTKLENLTSMKGTEEGQKVTDTSNYFASATTIDDLVEDAVRHLLKFLTADDVMALGQTSSKWRVICGPEWRKKKPLELSEAWSKLGHIPSASVVATVELLVAHNLLSSQIITRKAAAVSESWAKVGFFPTEEEVVFIALLAFKGHLPQQVPASKAAELVGNGSVLVSSLPKLVSAAALAAHGYITHVYVLTMADLDLGGVSAGNLANLVQCVSHRVRIFNIRGDLSPLLRSLRCRMLEMSDVNLSTANTKSLLAAMVSGVEEVELGMGVTLDMKTLAQYDGKGDCRRVSVWGDANERYRAQMLSWMRRIDWKLEKVHGFKTTYARKGSA